MGRNREIGLSYFPFSVDTFSDIKIRKLIKYQGGKAVTVYALLLCLIYKSGYYMRWDEELPFIVSEQTGFEEAYIQEVINSCLALGLFSKSLYDSDRVLTSKGIQTRYAEAMNFFRRKTEICEFSLISSEENGISSAFMPINSAKMPRKEREGKEKKENNFVVEEKPAPQEFESFSSSESPNDPVNTSFGSKKISGCGAAAFSPRNLRRTFDENVQDCLNSPQWQESVQINIGMRNIDWLDAFERFRANLVANGHDTNKSLSDFKQHFSNWLRIQRNEQLKNQQKNGKEEKMVGNDRQGGRAGLVRAEIASAKVVPAERGKSCI
ncbi:MAG: DUF4373 domain-containing protein [Bacteroidales bacterium]|nr:DUF4373 domain-containing protein [Bacteroidales bacterium]MDE7072473.1 DUF4373 domain-containing protein [Bacteroidales bacterium]